jgi:hypothetical protein
MSDRIQLIYDLTNPLASLAGGHTARHECDSVCRWEETMQLFGYTIIIFKNNSLPRGYRSRRKLAERVERQFINSGEKSVMIGRIKAVRTIRPGTRLVEAKEWVEESFADNGTGAIL